MEKFDVYPLYDIHPVKGLGAKLWDDEGQEYLDLYGGHAVISIGHSHPHFIKQLKDQLDDLAFYSNSVQNRKQEELAHLLGRISRCDAYRLFMCSTGAEAIENALKVASFQTGRKKVVAMEKAFHGRTSGAVAITDNPKIVSPFNSDHEVVFVPLNDHEALTEAVDDQTAAVIIEGLQGVAGIYEPSSEFLLHAQSCCKASGSLLILDEVQSGAGRTGNFFAFQKTHVQPDLITLAKGIGNGFPVAMVLVAPHIQAWHGMLGTTFGGNHLACVAAMSVLEIIEKEQLMKNAREMGQFLKEALQQLPEVQEVRGTGLMLGVQMAFPVADLRKRMLMDHHVFLGSSAEPNTFRLLPPLHITREDLDYFLYQLKLALKKS